MNDDAAAQHPRIAPGTLTQLGVFGWCVTRVLGLAARTKPPHLFTTLGRNPGLFRGWLSFASRLMPFGKLPRRESELVILRVAHLRSCVYERDHHVRLGKRAGLTSAEIARIAEGPDANGWSSRDRLLLRATDELHRTQDLPDALWAELSRELDEASCVELVMLVGHYEMLATAIKALRIQPDEPRSA